jgi:hypothetical protein
MLSVAQRKVRKSATLARHQAQRVSKLLGSVILVG